MMSVHRGEYQLKENRLYQEFLGNSNPNWQFLFKVKDRNTRTRCYICPELMIKTPASF